MTDPFSASPATVLDSAEAIEPPDDASLFLLYDETSHYFGTEGRHTWRQRRVFRILTREGVDAGSIVAASWAPWYQVQPTIRARILTPAGEERWLDPQTLSESPMIDAGADMFDDRRILQAPLPALEVGSIVIQEIIVENHRPHFAAGTHHREYLINPYPTHRGRLILQAPTTLPLRYGQRLAEGTALDQHLLQVNGVDHVRLVFRFDDRPAAEAPATHLPYSQPLFPSVSFSTGESWNAIARAYSQLVDAQLVDADLTEVLVGFPVDGDRRQKIDFLLSRVRSEVRYTGLELGAASIVPATPAEVLERQFGDCKDQATLLVGLLRRVGLEAHVALLRSDFGEDVEPELPGLGFFNHAVVYVPGDRPLWIDATDPFARAGELPLANQGRWALVASADTQRLVPIPTSNSVENRIVETREIFMSGYGAARVEETSVYHGSFERQQRALRSGGLDEHRQAYTNYVELEYGAASLTASEETPSTISVNP